MWLFKDDIELKFIPFLISAFIAFSLIADKKDTREILSEERQLEIKNYLNEMAIERSKIDVTPLKNSNVPVIFVIGGPGSGKGTQCERIVERYGFTHLSTGDLLRDEVNSGSDRGHQLNAIMERGELVPLDVVLDLLKEAMLRNLPTSKGYLIDGYPREVEQGVQFEKQIKVSNLILYFDVSDETMVKRLMKRGATSGRVDDNEQTIRKRLETFHKHSRPVVDHFKEKVKTIPAERHPSEIFEDVMRFLDAL